MSSVDAMPVSASDVSNVSVELRVLSFIVALCLPSTSGLSSGNFSEFKSSAEFRKCSGNVPSDIVNSCDDPKDMLSRLAINWARTIRKQR